MKGHVLGKLEVCSRKRRRISFGASTLDLAGKISLIPFHPGVDYNQTNTQVETEVNSSSGPWKTVKDGISVPPAPQYAG